MIHKINVDVINNDIYIRIQKKIEWYHAHKQDHNLLQIIDVSKRETDFIPDTVIPAKRNKTGLIITYPKFKLNSKSHRQINIFQHYIEYLPAWKSTIIREYKDNYRTQSLIELIQNEKIILVVSDGSKSTTKSVTSWVIADE